MTNDEILALWDVTVDSRTVENIDKISFAQAVAQEAARQEREQCVKVVENLDGWLGEDLVTAIRSRSSSREKLDALLDGRKATTFTAEDFGTPMFERSRSSATGEK